jgi:hypothetical protein
VQVRNHDDAGVRTTPGAFMRSDLPTAGFAVIEAASAEEAAELVSATPCAVAHGVVEVAGASDAWRAVADPPDTIVDARVSLYTATDERSPFK